MLTASSRLLRLLSLLQTRRHWSGAELAERLAVNPRTLRRDIDRLRELGYPIHASSGVAGGYAFRAGQALPPLLLDDEEAQAVAIALQTAAAGTVSGVEEGSLRALVKLEQVMPARLRRRLEALRSTILPLESLRPTVDAGVLASLALACRDQLRVAFAYRDSRGQDTARTVEPQGLVHTGSRWYLVAWDPAREDWRTFRLDRIEGAPTPGQH
jgi:predicted DNA-binding transcriptional regulator YafY